MLSSSSSSSSFVSLSLSLSLSPGRVVLCLVWCKNLCGKILDLENGAMVYGDGFS